MRFYAEAGGQSFVVKTIEDFEAREGDRIYYRVQVDGTWENRCLSDLPWALLEQILTAKGELWTRSVVEHFQTIIRQRTQ